jgi:hypothetical protein
LNQSDVATQKDRYDNDGNVKNNCGNSVGGALSNLMYGKDPLPTIPEYLCVGNGLVSGATIRPANFPPRKDNVPDHPEYHKTDSEPENRPFRPC